MLASLKYSLTHLFDFKGRDARQTFWYFAFFVLALYFIAWIVAIVPVIGSAIGGAMKAAQQGLPQEQVSAKVMEGMGPGLASIAWFSVIASLLFTLLLVAAFARRLHDSGNSGWWAGLVLLIKVGVLIPSIQAIGHLDEALQKASEAMQNASDPAAMQQQLQASQDPMQAWIGLIGWIGPIIMIVFGVMKSTDGPNRYGETSVSF